MVTLKLVTDGTPSGSRVYVVETGEEVKNVRSAIINVQAGQIPIMTLTLIKAKISATGTFLEAETETVEGNYVIVNKPEEVMDET
jgi:hypothetical protein